MCMCRCNNNDLCSIVANENPEQKPVQDRLPRRFSPCSLPLQQWAFEGCLLGILFQLAWYNSFSLQSSFISSCVRKYQEFHKAWLKHLLHLHLQVQCSCYIRALLWFNICPDKSTLAFVRWLFLPYLWEAFLATRIQWVLQQTRCVSLDVSLSKSQEFSGVWIGKSRAAIVL